MARLFEGPGVCNHGKKGLEKPSTKNPRNLHINPVPWGGLTTGAALAGRRTVVVDGVGQVVPQVLQGALARYGRLRPEAQVCQHGQPRVAHLYSPNAHNM